MDALLFDRRQTCSLCRHACERAYRGHGSAGWLCLECVVRLGRLVASNSPKARRLWPELKEVTGLPEGKHLALPAGPRVSRATISDQKAAVLAMLEAHADLATTYSEMKLKPDALREAAEALRLAPEAVRATQDSGRMGDHTKAVETALTVLIDGLPEPRAARVSDALYPC